MAVERPAGATLGPAQGPQSLGDQLVGLRAATCHREQPQHSGLPLGRTASEWQAGCDVLPQAGRVAAQASADRRGQELAAVYADQAELAGRLAEVGDRPGGVFAVALAEPVGVPAEMLHRFEDECRREVAGAGQLHAVTEPFEEPPV